MTSFRRVAAAATVATFVQIAVGGVVRATKSGLGCGTDWPDCGGRLLPALATRAEVIEFTHRAVAAVVVILVGALYYLARRHHRDRPRLVAVSLAAGAVVLSQAVLAAVVVTLELHALSVVLHLGIALALLALLLYLVAASMSLQGRLPSSPHPAVARRARWAAGAVLLLLLVGSYTTGRRAGYVFSDWPLMNGRLVPDLADELFAIHFLHRVLAGAVGVVVFVVTRSIVRRADRAPAAARLAQAASGLFAVEILIGAANVFTALNPAVVTAHLAVGAAIWALLVGAVLVSSEAPERVAARRAAPAASPVLEGGPT